MSSTGGGEGRWPFEPVGTASVGGQSGDSGAAWAPAGVAPAGVTPGAAVPPGTTTPPAQTAPVAPTATVAPPTRRAARLAAQASTAGGPTQPGPVAGAGATPVGAAPLGATPQTGAGDGDEPPTSGTGREGRRRPPVWLLVLIGLVVVGGVVAAVLLLGGDDEPEVVPGATVTLPVPTPTIDAIEREPGTPFADALPSEVLQFALTEFGEDTELRGAGALESYRLVLSDGGATELTVLAGQWRDAAGPQARLESVLAGLGDVPEASDAPADDAASDETATAPQAEAPPSPVQGPVLVDGQEVGRYVFEPRADGTGTIWWTNTTVFVQLDGPWAELMDVFTAFPL